MYFNDDADDEGDDADDSNDDADDSHDDADDDNNVNDDEDIGDALVVAKLDKQYNMLVIKNQNK